MSKFKVLALIVFLVFAQRPYLAACTCFSKHDKAFFEKSELIFKGKVIAYSDFYFEKLIEIKVMQVWKTEENFKIPSIFHLVETYSECGSGYQVDSVYMFYAYSQKGKKMRGELSECGLYYTTGCTGNSLWSNERNQDDLDSLKYYNYQILQDAIAEGFFSSREVMLQIDSIKTSRHQQELTELRKYFQAWETKRFYFELSILAAFLVALVLWLTRRNL